MSEWISVKDRLPESSDPVIAATDDYKSVGILVVPARYSGLWRDIDNVDCNCEEEELLSVTHWMPLPEPPK